MSREISTHVRRHANPAVTACLVTRDQVEASPRRLDHPLGQPVRHVLGRAFDDLDSVEFFLGVDGVGEDPVFVWPGETPFRRCGVRSRVGRARIGSSRQGRGRKSGVAVCDDESIEKGLLFHYTGWVSNLRVLVPEEIQLRSSDAPRPWGSKERWSSS